MIHSSRQLQGLCLDEGFAALRVYTEPRVFARAVQKLLTASACLTPHSRSVEG